MMLDIYDFYDKMERNHILLSFKGDITSELLTSILQIMESKLENLQEEPKVKKKVYNVLVECLQNLYHHADHVPVSFEMQNPEKYGVILMEKMDDGYKITTCNFISNIRVEELKEKINKINESSSDEIKELYKEILNHQEITEKGLGGLGLVDIARKTGNKLDYIFKKYDETFSAFCLSALVNDEKPE